MAKYRPNVAALLVDSKGRLLICERSGQDGSWQFPQGGVQKGEKAKAALYREVLEEVGIKKKWYEVTERKEGYRYDFPEGKKKEKGFDGQEQTYFLCVLKEGAPEPNLEYDSDEFQDYKWIKPKKFKAKWLPKWKREVYAAVLMDFFGVEMG